MRLRAELGAHAAALGRRLAEVAARAGANTSVLVFGPRGIGKTLVCNAHCSLRRMLLAEAQRQYQLQS